MKKIAVIVILLSVYFSTSVGVSAAPGPKNVEVTLSNTPAVVKVGETVMLTASTEKQGSSYSDNWSDAVKSLSIFDPDTDMYISKAEFTPQKAGIYTISYSIDMSAGESNIVFSGKIERIIEVTDPVTVAGADIRNLAIIPIYRDDGSIKAYSASGTIYTLWSNNTSTPYSSIFFAFGPDETEKNIDVTLYLNGVESIYTVTVKRQ